MNSDQTLVNRTASSTLITIIIPSKYPIVYNSGLMEELLV